MTDSTQNPNGSQTRTRLERPQDGRVVAGVAAGIAQYTQVSTGLIRLAFIIATVFGGFGLLAYVVAWLIMPAKGEARPVVENWLEDLNTPGRTTGALLIGVLAFVVIAALIPGGTAMAAALLIIGVLVARSRKNTQTI
jgi:phage shock protein PspC (stress-responsive transcriptional regulator)